MTKSGSVVRDPMVRGPWSGVRGPGSVVRDSMIQRFKDQGFTISDQ
jgi:hypothetical protein